MYVVRRAFKSGGEQYIPGQVLTSLDGISLAKSKVGEKKIIPLPKDMEEQQNLNSYFQLRHSTELNFPLPITQESKVEVVEPEKTVTSPTGVTPKTVTAQVKVQPTTVKASPLSSTGKAKAVKPLTAKTEEK